MGGFVVSKQLSPSSIATYLTCPRQFEFDYDHSLETASNDDMERYFNRGSVLDTALQKTADEVSPETDVAIVQDLARERFEEEWTEQTTVSDYPSPASYEYDRKISKAAIEDYLDPGTDGDGIEHLRRSIGTEVHLEWVDPERGPLHGYADNLVQTRDGLLIIDYKTSYSGRHFPNKSGSDIDKQVAGTKHYPSRIKKWLQIGLYCEGVKEHDSYTVGDEIRFIFYGLINSKTREPTADDYTVNVSGKPWEMTDLYRSKTETFEQLISSGIDGIRNQNFDPTGQTWELIQTETCDDCDYREACGDYLAEEVRFS
jgi:hypothetical protein